VGGRNTERGASSTMFCLKKCLDKWVAVQILNAAEFSLGRNEFGSAFVNAFLSCERFMIGLILSLSQLQGENIATSHSGLLNQFRNIVKGKLPEKFRIRIWKIMEDALRGRIPYFYGVVESEKIELIKNMIKIAKGLKNYLSKFIQ
jgi:hypothetical protein